MQFAWRQPSLCREVTEGGEGTGREGTGGMPAWPGTLLVMAWDGETLRLAHCQGQGEEGVRQMHHRDNLTNSWAALPVAP